MSAKMMVRLVTPPTYYEVYLGGLATGRYRLAQSELEQLVRDGAEALGWRIQAEERTNAEERVGW